MKHLLKGSLFLQVTALAWISVVSTAMQLCYGITPVLYHMASWVMLSGTAKSSAGWDQNDTNSLVIIIVLGKIFHKSLNNIIVHILCPYSRTPFTAKFLG
jgi:hypothetical protein